jgi:co-chaperonin GroES (HSP10)
MGAVIQLEEPTIESAFPDVDPGVEPFGARVLVQIRQPRTRSKGGIQYADETIENEKWSTQVALVRELGPGAFKDRKTNEEWPERAWCQPGDFIRVPRFGGDRWAVTVPGTTEKALFVIYRDLDLIGKVTGDPLAAIAFV